MGPVLAFALGLAVPVKIATIGAPLIALGPR